MQEDTHNALIMPYEDVWPPTEQQIINIAMTALDKSNKVNVKVLVYWDRKKTIIFEPQFFSDTEYLTYDCELDDRNVEVIIGRQD